MYSLNIYGGTKHSVDETVVSSLLDGVLDFHGVKAVRYALN